MAKKKEPEQQLSLWGSPPEPAAPAPQPEIEAPAKAKGKGVRAAAVDPKVVALAQAMPPEIRLGGSTWSFPGWHGSVYERKYSTGALAKDGLAAYARHPLFRMVGVDRTFYKPMTVEEQARYAEVVPADFRFLVKAHEALTLLRYPDLARYGERRGQINPRYLDAAYAADEVVGPTVAGLGERLGAILFQFPPRGGEHPEAFAARLGDFLARLPKGPAYAVELRNRTHLSTFYGEALRATGACHCFNVFPTMPDLATQARMAGGPGPVMPRTPMLIVRWIVRPGFTYASAGEEFAPFERLVSEDPDTRQTLAEMALAAARQGTPVLLSVHNLAEGSTPPSIVELAEKIVKLSR